MAILSTYEKLCYVRIIVYSKVGRERIEQLYWDKLIFPLRMKYDWYFKYRAALLQIKYPKNIVEIISDFYVPAEEDVAIILKYKISRKKAKVTEYLNKLQAYRDYYEKLNKSSLIPYDIKENADYIKAMAKIERLQQELIGLQKQIL